MFLTFFLKTKFQNMLFEVSDFRVFCVLITKQKLGTNGSVFLVLFMFKNKKRFSKTLTKHVVKLYSCVFKQGRF